jgi:hypothetical protein
MNDTGGMIAMAGTVFLASITILDHVLLNIATLLHSVQLQEASDVPQT